jgi:hypothetical protein
MGCFEQEVPKITKNDNASFVNKRMGRLRFLDFLEAAVAAGETRK